MAVTTPGNMVSAAGVRVARVLPSGATAMSVHSERRDGFEAGHAAEERPVCVDNEMLEFLDELRESGVTNMFGTRPYLMREFDLLTEKEASTVLGYWMKSFGERHPRG